MRQLTLAIIMISTMFASREVTAQSFWYTPPGYDYGYYYGLDLGSGVGFGYGAGVGVPLNPEVFMQTRTGTIPEPQFDPTAITSTPIVPAVQWHGKSKAPKQKIAKAVQIKKNVKATSKVTLPKTVQKANS